MNAMNWKKTLAIIISVLSLLIGMIIGYYSSILNSFMADISTVDDDGPGYNAEAVDRRIREGEPFSVLLLGVDAEEDVRNARTDTIIVTTVNPKDGNVKMVSIPRDTLVVMPNGMLEKINAAHAIGGLDLTVDMVSDYLQIPIHYYARIDFEGLIKLVDAVGGIKVNADFAFTENNAGGRSNMIEIKKGRQRLNGEEALGYARMRKQDPRGDFGRQDRQKEVIASIVNELKSISSLANFSSILKALRPHVSTNISRSNMLAAANIYRDASHDIENLTIVGTDDMVYFPHYGFEVWVWEAYPESLFEVQNELRHHLDMKPLKNLPTDAQTEFYKNIEDGVYDEEEIYQQPVAPPAPEYFEQPSAPETPVNQQIPNTYQPPVNQWENQEQQGIPESQGTGHEGITPPSEKVPQQAPPVEDPNIPAGEQAPVETPPAPPVETSPVTPPPTENGSE